MLQVTERNGILYITGTLLGERVRKSTGLPLGREGHARAMMEAEAARIVSSVGSKPIRGESITYEDAHKFYVGRKLREGPIDDGWSHKLNECLAYWKDEVVNDITAMDVEVWINDHLMWNRRTKKPTLRSAGTIKGILQIFKAVLNYARDHEVVERVPTVKLPFVNDARDLHLERDEVDQFLAWVQKERPDLKLVYSLLIFTGARLGEALRMRWGDVAGDEVRISKQAQRTKTKATRSVPIPHQLVPVLEAHKGKKRELVLGGRWSNSRAASPLLNRTLRRGCHAIGAKEGMRVHDLRHTFAFLCGQAGVDLGDLQLLMGHSHINMTMRYRGFCKSRATRLVRHL